ncbi:MAG: diaminopimelate decarboxylase [Candidatus Caenarcaniphilales bacterium]|nr:diaminopimelate decarboxylase [Candidatus Caenarcaniphilales bacterium]
MSSQTVSSSHLKPLTYSVDSEQEISIGSIKIKDLVKEFGSPLYVLCEETIRERARQYTQAFKDFYAADTLVVYASKALNTRAICKIIDQEGLGLDVVSGGELYTALSVSFPADRIIFHGNNKSYEELEMAIENEISSIMLDNFHELNLMSTILEENQALRSKKINFTIRLTPGIECHTHEYIKTGRIDSKFGFNLNEVDKVIKTIQELQSKYENISIKGLHAHIGSQIFETEPHKDVPNVLLQEFKKIQDTYNIKLQDLNVGGGLGIKYMESDDPPEIRDWVKIICDSVKANCEKLGLELPRILVEPGRSLLGPAGLTVYEVGNIKDIPGVRKYVAVDGGMADNVRPIMYQAEYEATVDSKVNSKDIEKVTVAGKYCESGDILIKDIDLPKVESKDLIVIFSTGAYNYSMASNYNRVTKPAMILVNQGKADIIVRRETLDDLIRLDQVPEHLS